ncbi:Proteasome subunit alpha type-2-a, partial [Globisporangium splendens]
MRAQTAKNGVVIATEKKLPTILVDETSTKKIAMLSENAGIVYSGLGPDYRVLVRKARKKAQTYFQKYKVLCKAKACFEHAPAAILVRELAAIMQEFTQSGGVRPFGVSILFAGFDDDGPQLYQIDPSGAYFGWKATAIGKDSVSAKTFLERRYNDDLEIEDAIHTALLTLREGFEGEMDENNIEVGIIKEDKKFHVLTPAEVKDYLEQAE